MVITYFGDGAFRLQSGETSLLIDPNSNRLKGDVVLRTLIAAAEADSFDDGASFSGEYEINGMQILGWEVPGESTDSHVKTVFRVEWEDIACVFLGHLSGPPPVEIFEKLGEADLLFLPVGGGHVMGPEDAVTVMKQMQAKITFPSFFASPKQFLSAVGVQVQLQEKYVGKRKDVMSEKGRVIVLEGVK